MAIEIENVLNGRPAPAHKQLGAKWVEVRIGGNQSGKEGKDEKRIETWPATPVEASLGINALLVAAAPAGVASF